jgi:calcineurin-like phosphoesterase
MKKLVLITLLTFCGCSNSTFCNLDAAFNNVADVVAEANSSFKKAEDKIFAVNPDNIIKPDPDPAKCPCKGTGVIRQGDNHVTQCPYHGKTTQVLKR